MSEEKEMSFLDHLEELRWHIVRSVIVIMICMVVAFIYTKWIFTNVIFAHCIRLDNGQSLFNRHVNLQISFNLVNTH